MLIALSPLPLSLRDGERCAVDFCGIPFCASSSSSIFDYKCFFGREISRAPSDDSPLRDWPTEIYRDGHIGWQAFVHLTTHWKARSQQIPRKLFGRGECAYICGRVQRFGRYTTREMGTLSFNFIDKGS